jgi:hypothetical protein
LENWKLRRALARPYFLRSTTRESRVRKPPCFSTAQLGLVVGQRLGQPVAHRAGLAREAAAGDGADDVVLMQPVGRDQRLLDDHLLSTGRAKYCGHLLPLTVNRPLPGLTQTRATAFLALAGRIGAALGVDLRLRTALDLGLGVEAVA